MTCLLLVLAVGSAWADQVALDPQNRLHAGVSWVTGPSGFGVQAGMDSRLTRFVAVDFGAFGSPIPLAEEDGMPDVSWRDSTVLRHGIYVTPGLRIPHGQPASWAWELFVRAGGGVVWAANLDPDLEVSGMGRYALEPKMGGTAGVDLMLRGKNLGVRVAGRAWMFEVLQITPTRSWIVARPQAAIEAVYQW